MERVLRAGWFSLALSALGACSFHSEPLLVGQRDHVSEQDHSPATGDDEQEPVRDAGMTQTPSAGAGGRGGASAAGTGAGGSAGTTATDAGTPAQDAAAPPEPATDAQADDAANPPVPDPHPDTGVVDSGKPPPDCACVCPHELKAVLSQKPADDCQLVECPPSECAPHPDCEFVAKRTSGYYVCDELHSWQEARDHCAALAGVSLVSIEDEIEDAFLFDQIGDKTWIGGNDLAKEGELRWDNGPVFWRGGAALDIQGPGGGGPGPGPGGGGPIVGGGPVDKAYANFLSYEPNDQGLGDEPGDCVMLYPQGDDESWADGACGDPHGYICEFELPAPAPGGPLPP